ncbi:TIGR03084 family metal-binding protein [Pseudonocardia spinosispora]|uniref:TIGR03084 family metal-binding protein n=1 Tax=Pseudonocardia spinosispora TaxID=103441 RepID=UPI00040CF2A6|nr:TIGR03084 family metal-binding protein [Pseudonocardia spinosispora]
MPVGMDQLTTDLAEETAALRAVLVELDADGWERATPAQGWAVRDQISHLAYFDDTAILSATDPDAFREKLLALVAEGGVSPDSIAEQYRGMPASELLAWFDRSRARLIEVFAALDPTTRVPWYGPEMSAASSVTARLMETWAHGQDVVDAAGAVREPTDRLRHVAHIGVRAAPFSYALHGRTAPTSPVRVELTSPSGDLWTWGPSDADDTVTGSALDFCLLVTQRRHRDDLSLSVSGPVATEWMSIAQAFAGEPGKGRDPLPA